MHLLAIILSVLTSLCFWFWANQPIWTKGPYEVAQFYHVHPESKQVTSFVKASGKWQLETRDSITGEFLRTVEVSLPKSLGVEMCCPNTAAHQVEHPLIVIQGQFISASQKTPGSRRMVVVDASTGKLLTPVPIDTNVPATAVCHGSRAVIPLEREALFFAYGKEPLRVPAIGSSAKIMLLGDNEHLLTTDGECLQIVPWSTGGVKSKGTHQQMTIVTRLTQLPDNHLLVSSYDFESGFRLRVEHWRWNSLALEKVGNSIELTPPESATVTYVGTSQAEAKIDRQGNIHLPTFATYGWPVPFRSLLTWCSKQGWNVSKYIRQFPQTVFHVLNFKNEVIGRYEQESNLDKPLSTNTAIRYQREEPRVSSYMIKAIRTLPQWPNALALGMIVYLLWYVYHRLRVGHAVRASTG